MPLKMARSHFEANTRRLSENGEGIENADGTILARCTTNVQVENRKPQKLQ
ncbi:MAG TPA: hypothetical protein VMB47_18650 [Candidatus Aquilonibacter sp.]|nr:hypothetical protein [Candidatus Aquilonibacter sp.]